MGTREQDLAAKNMSEAVDELIKNFEAYKDKFQELETVCESYKTVGDYLADENAVLMKFLKVLKKLAGKCETGGAFGADTINVINANKIISMLNGLKL